MLLQACLNGSRMRGEHPALPLMPEDLARDAQRVVSAGAQALHIHPRNAEGLQSLAYEDIAAALMAIRQCCPNLPCGVSTARWIEPDVSRRLQQIQGWTVQPDYVSVNFSEPGAEDLCAHFLSTQVGIEAGIWSVADARRLLTLGLANRCLRILIEPQEAVMEAALATVEAILQVLDEGEVGTPRLLHGDADEIVWPMLEVAFARGYETRIGLEDTLTLPDGRRAIDNADLVAFAVSRARPLELPEPRL
jgi:uncharacterized protein (DUF849 family)